MSAQYPIIRTMIKRELLGVGAPQEHAEILAA